MTSLPPFTRAALAAIAADPRLLERLGASFRFVLLDEATLLSPSEATVTAPNRNAEGALSSADPRSVVAFGFDSRHRVVIGRADGKADIVIRDRRVSSAHAALAPGDDPVTVTWLTDLRSSNGTFIGRDPLAPGDGGRVALTPGMTFRIADVSLVFADVTQLRAVIDDEQRGIKRV